MQDPGDLLRITAATMKQIQQAASATHRGIHHIGHIELLAGLQHNWRDAWVVRVADSREQVVHNLHTTRGGCKTRTLIDCPLARAQQALPDLVIQAAADVGPEEGAVAEVGRGGRLRGSPAPRHPWGALRLHEGHIAHYMRNLWMTKAVKAQAQAPLHIT